MFTNIIRKGRGLIPRTLRFFCTSNLPEAAQIIKDKPQPLNEQVLHLESGQINVKFNDSSVSYELPEKISGATYGKLPLTLKTNRGST